MRVTTTIFAILAALCIASSFASASEAYKVKFNVQLKKGKKDFFVMEVHPKWAPKGADRFKEMIAEDFFTGCRFFRVINGFMAQFGIAAKPEVASLWRNKPITDDPVKESNKRGMVSFATSGPNSRTTQVFINFNNNNNLDNMGFSPFAKIVEGMDVVDKLYDGYGEGAPSGNGPEQGKIQSQGNTYLKRSFPKLSYIISTELME